jgi:hypothetical protein
MSSVVTPVWQGGAAPTGGKQHQMTFTHSQLLKQLLLLLQF